MVSRPNDSHWNDDVSTQHDCPLPQPASPMVGFRSSARDCVRQAWHSRSEQASRSDNHSQTYQRATDALPRNQRAKLTYRPTDKSSLKTTVSLPFLTQAKLDRTEAIRRNDRRWFYDRQTNWPQSLYAIFCENGTLLEDLGCSFVLISNRKSKTIILDKDFRTRRLFIEIITLSELFIKKLLISTELRIEILV